MENKSNIIAFVKSPSKNAQLRESHGFSLKEIKEAGKSIDFLKKSKIKIDYFRKSAYPENIKMLKSFKFSVPEKKKKKKPFAKKEKQRTPFKPIEEKIKKKPKVTPVKPVPKPIKKERAKPAKEEIKKPVKIKEAPVQVTGKPLTELSGLGTATANKFIELGVNDIETLCKENPEELALLIKGVSLERLKKWIEEGKELI